MAGEEREEGERSKGEGGRMKEREVGREGRRRGGENGEEFVRGQNLGVEEKENTRKLLK